MGEAKRRREQDPLFGLPEEWSLKFMDKAGRELAWLPYRVRRQSSSVRTNELAYAVGVLIADYLGTPNDPERQYAVWLAIEASETQDGRKVREDSLRRQFLEQWETSQTKAVLDVASEMVGTEWYCIPYRFHTKPLVDEQGKLCALGQRSAMPPELLEDAVPVPQGAFSKLVLTGDW